MIDNTSIRYGTGTTVLFTRGAESIHWTWGCEESVIDLFDWLNTILCVYRDEKYDLLELLYLLLLGIIVAYFSSFSWPNRLLLPPLVLLWFSCLIFFTISILHLYFEEFYLYFVLGRQNFLWWVSLNLFISFDCHIARSIVFCYTCWFILTVFVFDVRVITDCPVRCCFVLALYLSCFVNPLPPEMVRSFCLLVSYPLHLVVVTFQQLIPVFY